MNKKTLTSLAMLISVFVIPVVFGEGVAATDYHINPSGTDSGNCPINNPCKTLSYVDSMLNPGDTLYCRGGVYTDTSDYFQSARAGTQSQPITIRNYPGETPVFRTLGNGNNILVLQHDWYVFERLEFRPTSTTLICEYPILITGDHNIFRNVTIIGIDISDPNTRWSFGLNCRIQGDYNEIDSCTMAKGGWVTDNMGSSGGVVQIQGGDYNSVHDCDLSYGTHGVIQLYTYGGYLGDKPTYNEIYDNTITHAVGYGIETSSGERNLIEGNNITGCDELIDYVKCPLFFKSDYEIWRYNVGWNNEKHGLAMQDGATYNKVYNNVLYNSGQAGVKGHRIWGSSSHNRLINNLFAHNDATSCCGEIYDSASNYKFWEPDGSNDNHMYYNYIVAYANGEWKNDYAQSVKINYGATGYKTVSYIETNYILWHDNIYNYCDPKFVDPSTGDFTLQNGSCLIDAGTTLTTANGAGSSNSLVVDDAGWFWQGDEIMIGGSATRTISSIDYNNHILTLDSPASWSDGDTVTLSYSGLAPDIGAFEFYSSGAPQTCQELAGPNWDCCTAGEICPGTSYPGSSDCLSPNICCSAACTVPICGNNIREGSEVCDGTDLVGENCISQGFTGGNLSCLSNCSGFNTTECTLQPPCSDQDGDGYGDPASATCTHPEVDCNDTNSSINPGAQETCGDGIDYDCDGQDSNGYNLGSQCGGGNLALNKPVNASREDWGTNASWMVDGIWDGSHWSAQGAPNWFEVDLGNEYNINQINIGPYGLAGGGNCYYENAWNMKYRNSSSSTWNDFSNVVKLSGSGDLLFLGINITNGQPPYDTCDDNYKFYNFTFNPVTARHIRYEVTEGDKDDDTNGNEIEIYGAGSGTLVCDGLYTTKCESQLYHRADNNPQNGCITMQELMAFIDNWKMDSTNYPMPELMDAIGLWKQGTGCN